MTVVEEVREITDIIIGADWALEGSESAVVICRKNAQRELEIIGVTECTEAWQRVFERAGPCDLGGAVLRIPCRGEANG